MVRPTSEPPPLAAAERAKVEAQPLAVGVFGSHGGSAGRPALLPGSVPAPGSGTRYDASVKPRVNKERGSPIPMLRDVVRSLFIDAAAYDSVLGALPINATACEYMELVAVLGSALLRKVWRRRRLFGICRWVTFFYPTHRRGSCSALIWRSKRVSPDIAFITGALPWRPGRRGAGRRFASRNRLRQPP